MLDRQPVLAGLNAAAEVQRHRAQAHAVQTSIEQRARQHRAGADALTLADPRELAEAAEKGQRLVGVSAVQCPIRAEAQQYGQGRELQRAVGADAQHVGIGVRAQRRAVQLGGHIDPRAAARKADFIQAVIGGRQRQAAEVGLQFGRQLAAADHPLQPARAQLMADRQLPARIRIEADLAADAGAAVAVVGDALAEQLQRLARGFVVGEGLQVVASIAAEGLMQLGQHAGALANIDPVAPLAAA